MSSFGSESRILDEERILVLEVPSLLGDTVAIIFTCELRSLLIFAAMESGLVVMIEFRL